MGEAPEGRNTLALNTTGVVEQTLDPLAVGFDLAEPLGRLQVLAGGAFGLAVEAIAVETQAL